MHRDPASLKPRNVNGRHICNPSNCNLAACRACGGKPTKTLGFGYGVLWKHENASELDEPEDTRINHVPKRKCYGPWRFVVDKCSKRCKPVRMPNYFQHFWNGINEAYKRAHGSHKASHFSVNCSIPRPIKTLFLDENPLFS
jgi:hypothetical protein